MVEHDYFYDLFTLFVQIDSEDKQRYEQDERVEVSELKPEEIIIDMAFDQETQEWTFLDFAYFSCVPAFDT